jgi:hypothetical protein
LSIIFKILKKIVLYQPYFSVDHVKDKKTLLATQRQRLLENYETLNTLKQQWDSLCAQHHSLSQRYLPANLEVIVQLQPTI